MGVATVLTLIGLVLLAGGIWLITLGGSWYYAIAGIGLLLTAWPLFRHLTQGVLVYLVVWLGTLIWTYWEVGTDWWAWVPRMVAPTVILVILLLCLPMLSLRRRT
ncbi:glucose dehydrogenase [Mesobaculum littorinae]|uniref:Glucose dehydrogenase n=2 Tax=Mesobaculum littorinae TaxID=2486419 RepID=A0A438AN50_9RHOB|nr:glucose dehydrogenase [Mesobaculum littorinae]